MTTYANGDEVKITIKGKVASDKGNVSHDYCREVRDADGFTHHVFLDGAGGINSGCIVDVVRRAESFTVGRAYEDADGDVFIRSAEDGWIDHFGNTRTESYPSRPLKPLETATTVTEAKLADLVRAAVRSRGAGPALSGSSASIARELVRNGVKVASK